MPPLRVCRGVNPPVRGFGGSAPEKKKKKNSTSGNVSHI
jgi:hypothetical protein